MVYSVRVCKHVSNPLVSGRMSSDVGLMSQFSSLYFSMGGHGHCIWTLATSLCKHSRKIFDGYEPIFIVGHSNVDSGTKYDLLVVNLINTYMCRRESCSNYTTEEGSNVKAKENS